MLTFNICVVGDHNESHDEKSTQRDANTARALAVVRFGHRPPVANTQSHRQDR